jgi:hypothetical protein
VRLEEASRLGLELLDHQLVDCDGVLCGNVDDLRFEVEGDCAVLAGILSGPGTWPERLPRPLRGLARAVLFDTVLEIAIEEVAEISGGTVHLKRPARELGLGRGEENASRWLARIPGSRVGKEQP